jgi:hypothetical protein
MIVYSAAEAAAPSDWSLNNQFLQTDHKGANGVFRVLSIGAKPLVK